MQILNEIRLTDEEVETLNKALVIIEKISDAVDKNENEVFDCILAKSSYSSGGYKATSVYSISELNNW